MQIFNYSPIGDILRQGFSEDGKKYLNKIKKDITTPILNKYNTSYNALKIEKRVSEIYSLIYDDIMDMEIKNKPIKEDDK